MSDLTEPVTPALTNEHVAAEIERNALETLPPRNARHPLAIPDFRYLWIGTIISVLGDQLFVIALPWLILTLTGSTAILGTILMSEAIPRAALMLVGGVMTDRFSARRVMITTVCARAIVVGVLALCVHWNKIETWELFVVAICFGVADAFALPAGAALVPTILKDPRELGVANSLLQSSLTASEMLGRAPAGIIVGRFGPTPALAADSISFVAVIVALLRLQSTPAGPRPSVNAMSSHAAGVWHDIVDGLRWVRRDRPLFVVILMFAAINLCTAGPIAVGVPAIARLRFGTASAFGSLLSCFSGGALVGMIIPSVVRLQQRRGILLLAMCGATAVEICLLGALSGFAELAVLLACMGAGVGLITVVFTTWVQMRVQPATMGCIMGFLMFCSAGTIPLSFAVSGFLAAWSLKGVYMIASATLAVVTLAASLSKEVRKIA